ncbi:hypothetical protein GIB67_007918 [Kingdonia uniflora]|uniref:Uncharacterized protein n=1 Tax=Kingdonia uniflora TaxID=39325 RepID=A0A7J7PAQ6_9MAGN|nr:hypothetical protein GIB67_007918 [Kingdonia uniflora]
MQDDFLEENLNFDIEAIPDVVSQTVMQEDAMHMLNNFAYEKNDKEDVYGSNTKEAVLHVEQRFLDDNMILFKRRSKAYKLRYWVVVVGVVVVAVSHGVEAWLSIRRVWLGVPAVRSSVAAVVSVPVIVFLDKTNMAPKTYYLIENINHTIERWRLKVRVSRLWNMLDFGNKKNTNRIEMLLIVEKGEKIHAVIHKKLIPSYEKFLKEGSVYIIDRFSVEHQQGNYRPCDHTYKITIKWDTKLTSIDGINDEIPLYKFQFLSFKDYQQDVIGRLHTISETKNYNKEDGQSFRRRDIMIKDESGYVLKITLWDDIVDQIPLNIFDDKESNKIVIATSTIGKEFQGIYHLSSTMSTKLYINLGIPEGKFFCCKATIAKVLNDTTWYYMSCEQCKKTVFNDEITYWCKTCNMPIPRPAPRYYLRLKIEDTMGFLNIIAFENEAEILTQNPANSLFDLYNQEEEYKSAFAILDKMIGTN